MTPLRSLTAYAALALLALAPAAQAQFTYTGTTVGGPTFNRPVENGLFAPAALSSVGTAVQYQAQTFTVGTSGFYDLSSLATNPSGWDNYTFLYQGTFTPASPLANAIFGNDNDNDTVGTSGFLGVGLDAGQTYTFVTTGFGNTDVGDFVNSVALETDFQTGDTTGGPTWDPFGDGEAIPYSVTSFMVDTTGNYNFLSGADFDNIAVLYENAFDPLNVLDNFLNFNDDSSAIGRSGFLGQELQAGRTYYFVTSGFDDTSFGTFANSISGPGAIVTVAPVPEPGSVALLIGMVSTGVGCLARRRKQASKAA